MKSILKNSKVFLFTITLCLFSFSATGSLKQIKEDYASSSSEEETVTETGTKETKDKINFCKKITGKCIKGAIVGASCGATWALSSNPSCEVTGMENFIAKLQTVAIGGFVGSFVGALQYGAKTVLKSQGIEIEFSSIKNLFPSLTKAKKE